MLQTLSYFEELLMNYFSPYDIGIGDKVTYKGNIYDVLINYIKGETDAKGYTPEKDYTVLELSLIHISEPTRPY